MWWLAMSLVCSHCAAPPPACATAERCFQLADALAHGDGVPQNEGLAAELFAAICEKSNDGAACYNAGMLSDDVHFFDKGCAAKEPLACYEHGLSLLDSDPPKARALLTRACRAHVTEACEELNPRK